ncbi:hypothetical protein ACS0TY_026410 [Phlomoides rotata]
MLDATIGVIGTESTIAPVWSSICPDELREKRSRAAARFVPAPPSCTLPESTIAAIWSSAAAASLLLQPPWFAASATQASVTLLLRDPAPPAAAVRVQLRRRRLQQVRVHDGTQVCVNLDEHTCSCRMWELSGIPCKHAISAITHKRENIEDFVSDWYSVEVYKRSYAPSIKGITGSMLWVESCFILPLPPKWGEEKGGQQELEGMSLMNNKGKEKRRGKGEDQQQQ